MARMKRKGKKRNRQLSENWIRIQRIAVVLAVFLVICACTGMSCEERADELKSLYNDTVDQAATLSLDDIVNKCDEALKKCPDMSIAHELKGLVYWEANRLNQALECYLKALTANPEDENLLIDTRLLAYSAKGAYLQISDTGRIEMTPFKKITLAQYAGCPEENRLQWCRQLTDIHKSIIQQPPVTTKYVDRKGNLVGLSKMTYQFDSDSPADLDALLLSASKTKPDAILYEESALQSTLGMGMRQVTK